MDFALIWQGSPYILIKICIQTHCCTCSPVVEPCDWDSMCWKEWVIFHFVMDYEDVWWGAGSHHSEELLNEKIASDTRRNLKHLLHLCSGCLSPKCVWLYVKCARNNTWTQQAKWMFPQFRQNEDEQLGQKLCNAVSIALCCHAEIH